MDLGEHGHNNTEDIIFALHSINIIWLLCTFGTFDGPSSIISYGLDLLLD